MSLSKAQFYYSRLKVVSDEYRAKLEWLCFCMGWWMKREASNRKTHADLL
jgi:hypothetical protein